MRYEPAKASLYIKNRAKVADKLPSNSLAVINSNDILPTNADGTMKFRQNNDLLYLCGIDQEETILVICPDFPDPDLREILFIKPTSEHIAIWEGHKFTMEEAAALSGIKTIKWNTDFDKFFNTLMQLSKHVFLNTNEHPLHQYHRLAPIMHKFRAVKEPEEITQLQKACDITDAAFRRVLKFVKPGVLEYEIEAEFLHEFIKSGSRGFAYEPIIGSGRNACVLHYLDNSVACADGDLILMDVGAEYGNYNADMTRTIPVNGRFTKRQRQIYDAVLRVQQQAMNMLRPGIDIQSYHKEIGLVMEAELISLGLIDKTDVQNQDHANPAYKKYFMHGTSHHLGLDVHDVGTMYEPIQAGMVFTVEPGIYVLEEGIGIRLENNIVINDNGYTDLMGNIPIDPEEIETLMNEK